MYTLKLLRVIFLVVFFVWLKQQKYDFWEFDATTLHPPTVLPGVRSLSTGPSFLSHTGQEAERPYGLGEVEGDWQEALRKLPDHWNSL